MARALVAISRNSIFGRGLVRKALYRAFGKLHPGPADTMLWNKHVRLYPERNSTERKALMRPDMMDPYELTLLRSVVAKHGTVFVDVRANVGIYSLAAAINAGEGTRIILIEPDSSLLARFSFNEAQARRAGHVKASVKIDAFDVAISDREGTAMLSNAKNEGARTLTGLDSAGTKVVNLTTLDALIAKTGVDHIDIMKIDVEGHEDKVLSPYLASVPIEKWPRTIVIERARQAMWSSDCIADALKRGYRETWKNHSNTILNLG